MVSILLGTIIIVQQGVSLRPYVNRTFVIHLVVIGIPGVIGGAVVAEYLNPDIYKKHRKGEWFCLFKLT